MDTVDLCIFVFSANMMLSFNATNDKSILHFLSLDPNRATWLIQKREVCSFVSVTCIDTTKHVAFVSEIRLQ